MFEKTLSLELQPHKQSWNSDTLHIFGLFLVDKEEIVFSTTTLSLESYAA